jgi:hypothetical protein
MTAVEVVAPKFGVNDLCNSERKQLVDQHQVISIIATAVCECFNERPDQKISVEEAKQIAKCVIEALAEAGLEIGTPNDS